MDRNVSLTALNLRLRRSLSARRAWIEIDSDVNSASGTLVALRKESVDRNCTVCKVCLCQTCRSPQGERG